jgi:tetratricopeptide (TPR) repeat protein
VKARPEDVIVLRTAADFYLRTNDLAEAEACLRKVIGLGAKDAEAATWARSVLAVVLAASGDYQRSREAMKLVGLTDEKAEKAPPPSQNVEQERSMAAVLALKPGRREHLRAIEILERLAGRQALSREDRFLLIQLYEQVGKPQRAWDLMVPLLQAGGNPRYLAHAVGFLLDQNRFDEAEPWLADLEKLQRQSLPLRTVYLRARLLKGRGKAPDGMALLVKAATEKDAVTAVRVAVLIENFGYAAEAENLYRRYAKEAKEPDAVLVLAQYLGRRKRTAEALDLCEGAWEKCRPAAVAEASLAVLNAAPGTEEQFGRLEKRLTAALEKQPDQSELVLCAASLCELRGQYDAAEALYRKVLARDARNAVAANNLAWILALREGKGDDALAYVGRAIDVLGPIPELLDTRALAYLAAGQADVALADLREALDRPGLDAKVRSSLYYHLIQAELRTGGRREDVEKTWRDAATQGLARDVLHPLERAAYDKLAGELGRP